MSLRPIELAQIAAELGTQLAGAVVQKANSPVPGRLWLELRLPGKSIGLHLCAAPQVGRISISDDRPRGTPGEASGFQHLLRQRLTGTSLVSATAAAQRVTLTFDVAGSPQPALDSARAERSDAETNTETNTQLQVHLELSAPPAILFTSGDRVLAVTSETTIPEHAGVHYVPRASAAPPGTSRLEGPSSARAAETLFAGDEKARALEAARKPLLTALARLARTRKKVEAEAARTENADRHRRDGELLKQHLGEVPRGAREVTLTEYLPSGEIEQRTLKLDPARTPLQQAQWLFHQYKRLTRGAEFSLKRLATLDAEKAALEARVSALDEAPPPTSARRKKTEPVSRPYREYLARNGERIWVGKGSADNDTLTFKLGRPYHLWLHARGVPGAHVVIPLAKGATAPQELLLDAAHLALHHSDLKGQARGEVSYVSLKHVRKVRGVAGAVSFSQEKTFVLRLEPERLHRLLASEQ